MISFGGVNLVRGFADDPWSAPPERDLARLNYALSARFKQSEIDGIPSSKAHERKARTLLA